MLDDFAPKSLLRRSPSWLPGLEMIGSTPAMPAQESSGFGGSTPDVPGRVLPGSPTHVQVPPPADFHRARRTRDTPIGTFQGHSGVRCRGKPCFVKGRFSTGYAILMDQAGEKVNLKPIPKLSRMTRLPARSSWRVSEQMTLSR